VLPRPAGRCALIVQQAGYAPGAGGQRLGQAGEGLDVEGGAVLGRLEVGQPPAVEDALHPDLVGEGRIGDEGRDEGQLTLSKLVGVERVLRGVGVAGLRAPAFFCRCGVTFSAELGASVGVGSLRPSGHHPLGASSQWPGMGRLRTRA
jgi:hypothetical protein